MDPALTDKFEITWKGLHAWQPFGGFVVPAWITFTIYWIGLAAACFHFSNGIWSFCVAWGLIIGPKAQRRVLILGGLMGLALFIGGSAGLCAFATAGPGGEKQPRHDPMIVKQAHAP
jgi:hypothetical protein